MNNKVSGKNLNPDKKAQVRLSRFMSLAGVASRRKCEEIILTGAVTVNGEVIKEVGTKVKNSDNILYNGMKIQVKDKIYIMLNKPVGYLCTAHDPHGGKTVYDIVKIPEKRLFSAGRLDLNSEGLLILTNDGDYAEKLMHPRYETIKQYLVKTAAPLNSRNLEKIRKGINDEGEFLKPKSVKEIREKEYLFIMTEGKKREIRRLIAAVEGKVISLKRIAIGSLNLGKLATGKWKYLTQKEIKQSLSK